MEAGKELDALVERHIFGFVWDEKRCRICGWPLYESDREGCVLDNCALRPAPKTKADEPSPFSTDDAQAFRLLLKMQDIWTDVTVESAGAEWHVSTPISGDSDKDLKVALCNAALKSAQIPVTGFDL
jgi:hypothetical protein